MLIVHNLLKIPSKYKKAIKSFTKVEFKTQVTFHPRAWLEKVESKETRGEFQPAQAGAAGHQAGQPTVK